MNHYPKQITTLIIIMFSFALLSTGVVNQSGEASASSNVLHAQAFASQPGGGELSARSTSTSWKAASRPWTKERMLAAQPYLLDVQINSSDLTAELQQPSGDPGFVPSSQPLGTDSIPTVGDDLDIKSSAALTADSFPYSYVPPYTSFDNFDLYDRFPYSTVGVLFFSRDGSDFHCSAASIGYDAVWTAGSCIHKGDGTGNGWSDDVIFVPAYKDGEKPFGQWTAYNLWTKSQWYFDGDHSFDMGGVKLNRNGSGKTISEVVGSLGFAYNLSEFQAWFNVGYPDPPQWQHICVASYAYSDTAQNSPNPLAMGCDMNSGSTGGPWIMSFGGSSGTANFLNGNASYKISGETEAIFSPYFGDAAKSLWDRLMAHNYLPVIVR